LTLNADGHSPQGHDELNAVELFTLEPLIVGDEKIQLGVCSAGQL